MHKNAFFSPTRARRPRGKHMEKKEEEEEEKWGGIFLVLRVCGKGRRKGRKEGGMKTQKFGATPKNALSVLVGASILSILRPLLKVLKTEKCIFPIFLLPQVFTPRKTFWIHPPPSHKPTTQTPQQSREGEAMFISFRGQPCPSLSQSIDEKQFPRPRKFPSRVLRALIVHLAPILRS